MDFLDFQMDQFILALNIYMDHPNDNTRFQLQRKTMDLQLAIRDYTKELEERVTNNVLNAISVKIEKECAIKEIKSLKKAIEDLGR